MVASRSSDKANIPLTYYFADGIHITNNININTGRPNHTQSPRNQYQQSERSQPMSPRIALESLRPGHPLGQTENQPWMHQDQNGRWVPLNEGYLHPGLPPPPRAWQAGNEYSRVDQYENPRRAELHVPGEWEY